MTRCLMLGGPEDGGIRELVAGTDCYEAVIGPKTYLYLCDLRLPGRFYYKGERLTDDVPEGGQMKKFGTGQIIPEQTPEEISKTATTEWTGKDETALTDEQQED